MDGGGHPRQQGGSFFHQPRLPYYQIKPNNYNKHHFRQHGHRHHNHEQGPTNATTFDQKRLKNNLLRRTVDYNATVIKYLKSRIWQRDYRDARMIQPDHTYVSDLTLPNAMLDNPINAVTTRFVRTSSNKVRCPVFCVVWTPEGRRLVTGASSGEFTLWNGLTFNFETILQAHEYAVRTMTWSHNDMWLLTGDDLGYVKYWQSNMNNVQMYQAHKDQAVRCASFAPFDSKFCTCSDDGTVRIWDFLRCHEERILRGHGADVRCVDWHPHKSIVVSGSKDSQQPVKIWDARSGEALATLHAHKSTVMSAKWNSNGNWLLTASRDHLVKLFDIRMMKEINTFRGHKKEAICIAWHPVHENLFASGGSDGAILFWQVGNEKEVGGIEEAHESIIWGLAWHPLGHMLCSGSNDHSTKFWTRNRPGDKMRDRYNLNTLPIGTSEDLLEFDDDTSALPVIPGMGLEYGVSDHMKKEEPVAAPVVEETLDTSIPGLDSSLEELERLKPKPTRKVPYARPVPANFLEEWEANKAPGVAPNIEEERRKKKEEEEKKKREEEEKKRREMESKRAKEAPQAQGLVSIPDFGGDPVQVIKFIAQSQGPQAAQHALVSVIQGSLPSGTVLPIIKPHEDPILVLLREGHIPPHFAAKLEREGFLPSQAKEPPPPPKQKDMKKEKPIPRHLARLPIATPPPKPLGKKENGKENEIKSGKKQGLLGDKPADEDKPPGLLGDKPPNSGLLPDPEKGPANTLLPEPKPAAPLGMKQPLMPTPPTMEEPGKGDVDLRQGSPQFGDVDMRTGMGGIGNPLLEEKGGEVPPQDVPKRNGPMVKSGEQFGGQDRDERVGLPGMGDVDFRQSPGPTEDFGDQDLRQQGLGQRFNGPSTRNRGRQQPQLPQPLVQDVDNRTFPADSRIAVDDNSATGGQDEDLRGPVPLMSIDTSSLRTRDLQDQDFRHGGGGIGRGGGDMLPPQDFDERQLPLMDQEEFPPLPHRKRVWEEGPGEPEGGPSGLIEGGPEFVEGGPEFVEGGPEFMGPGPDMGGGRGGGRGRGMWGRGGFGPERGRGGFRGRGRGWGRGRGNMW